MRKFFAGFIILLILGGLAFFFGWAQLQVPPGSYGVIRSKTHGVDPRLVREGEFRWVWYKLIPTNVTITVFSPARVEKPVKSSGTLPQADSYKAFLDLDADFSYEMAGSFAFSIKPDALAALILEQGLTGQEDLEKYQEKLASDLGLFIEQTLESYAEDQDFFKGFLESPGHPRLFEDIRRAYPEAENLSYTIHAVRSPDFEFYRSARSLYEDYLARQHELLALEVRESAGKHISSRFRLEELARYGELLTKYPILLQFLALEKGEAE